MPLPLWMIKSLAALFPSTQDRPRRPLATPRSRKMRVEVLENRCLLAVTAMPDSFEVLHDQSLWGEVLMNDYDPEMSMLTASLLSGPTNGTLNFNSDGTFTYEPDEHWAGSDSFLYEATNGTDSAQGTASITVMNNAPFSNHGNDSVLHDQTLSSFVTAYDVDGDNLTFTLAAGPYQGMVVLDSSGTLTYTPLANQAYDETFTFVVTDDVATVTGAFTVHVTNTAPVASDSTDGVVHGQMLSSFVNAYDVDGDNVTYSVMSSPANGTLSLDSSGTFTYTPNALFAGNDSFTFAATDGIATDSGVITINVTNNAPVASNGSDTMN
jgi:VCBS repeat-containing protein